MQMHLGMFHTAARKNDTSEIFEAYRTVQEQRI